jgi:hypothetical protein
VENNYNNRPYRVPLGLGRRPCFRGLRPWSSARPVGSRGSGLPPAPGDLDAGPWGSGLPPAPWDLDAGPWGSGLPPVPRDPAYRRLPGIWTPVPGDPAYRRLPGIWPAYRRLPGIWTPAPGDLAGCRNPGDPAGCRVPRGSGVSDSMYVPVLHWRAPATVRPAFYPNRVLYCFAACAAHKPRAFPAKIAAILLG